MYKFSTVTYTRPSSHVYDTSPHLSSLSFHSQLVEQIRQSSFIHNRNMIKHKWRVRILFPERFSYLLAVTGSVVLLHCCTCRDQKRGTSRYCDHVIGYPNRIGTVLDTVTDRSISLLRCETRLTDYCVVVVPVNCGHAENTRSPCVYHGR